MHSGQSDCIPMSCITAGGHVNINHRGLPLLLYHGFPNLYLPYLFVSFTWHSYPGPPVDTRLKQTLPTIPWWSCWQVWTPSLNIYSPSLFIPPPPIETHPLLLPDGTFTKTLFRIPGSAKNCTPYNNHEQFIFSSDKHDIWSRISSWLCWPSDRVYTYGYFYNPSFSFVASYS